MGKRLMRVMAISAVILGIIICGGTLTWKNLSLENKIKLTIIKDRPQMLICKDEEEKLDLIRDWVYENTVMAWEKGCYSDDSAEQYLSMLMKGEYIEYGYYCGGIAAVLKYIYTCMGYEACSLDLAVFQQDQVLASHVVTLVYVEEKWIIEDATFNITYTDMAGEHLDIQSLRESFLSGDEFCVEHGRTMFRPCIYPSLEHIKQSTEIEVYEKKDNHFWERNGRYFDLINTDINRYFERQLPEEVLFIFAEDGYDINEAILYMYPYDIYIPSNVAGDEMYKYTELRQILEIE